MQIPLYLNSGPLNSYNPKVGHFEVCTMFPKLFIMWSTYNIRRLFNLFLFSNKLLSTTQVSNYLPCICRFQKCLVFFTPMKLSIWGKKKQVCFPVISQNLPSLITCQAICWYSACFLTELSNLGWFNAVSDVTV